MEKTEKNTQYNACVALAGNPNVGKSTLFNALTGLDQHTGNWAGKTVTSAVGSFEHNGKSYLLADIPGTYSLLASSPEEQVARDMICFGDNDAVVVVCDGVCLERNLNLVYQILETQQPVLVCVNLIDEAEKKHISVNINKLSELLGVPVAAVSARNEVGLGELCQSLEKLLEDAGKPLSESTVTYCDEIEQEIEELSTLLTPIVEKSAQCKISPRWAAVRALSRDRQAMDKIGEMTCTDLGQELGELVEECTKRLYEKGFDEVRINDSVAAAFVKKAEETAKLTVTMPHNAQERDRVIDRVLTSRVFGIPIMLGVLGLVFWITVVGSNYPSQFLSWATFSLGEQLEKFLLYIGCHHTVTDALINGVYRVLAWVVSVMLPPMAIFFPLFTLLEDLGYLPRVAFNLDKPFRKCGGCGKQSLTMAMGLGCNAAGVTGCRIVDSPRERLTAILTNSFMPCNGRFPTLITLLTLFFTARFSGTFGSLVSAAMLLGLIILGVLAALMVSLILSGTLLKGMPSMFVLELPPYRVPKVGSVIVRSMLDRTIFVLGRACVVAAPAGLVIWLLGNITAGDATLLQHLSQFLDPVGRVLGMDGVILVGFLLGFPANEIVLPVMLMCYTSAGTLVEASDTEMLKTVLTENGWGTVTALCVLIFTLFHFPCSTTCLTIKKETGSLKWTGAAMAIPTLLGCLLCYCIKGVSGMF